MNQKQLRLIIILGFVVISAGIVGIIVLIQNQNSAQNQTYTQETYVDPASGETISETDGKTPESFGRNPDLPLYSGFSILLERGLAQDEINELTNFVNDYNNQLITEGKPKLKEVSLYRDSVQHRIEKNVDTFQMDLLIDRTIGYVLTRVQNDNTAKLTYTLHKGVNTADPVVYSKTEDIVY